MSVREVMELRRTRRWDEALAMAEREYNGNPDDSWCQMSLFWVLRDLCQQVYLPAQNREEASRCMERMHLLLPTMMDDKGLGERAYMALSKQLIPGAEQIMHASDLSKTDAVAAYEQVKPYIENSKEVDETLHEDLGWILYRYIKAKGEELSSVQTRTHLRDYMIMQNERPSLLHSQMLRYALNFSKDHADFSFYRFFLLWGMSNLREEDFRTSTFNDKTVASLFSHICRAIVESGEEVDMDRFFEELALPKEQIVEEFRESVFWRLIALKKENRTRELYTALEQYNAHFAQYGPSTFHSKILDLACRVYPESSYSHFLSFFEAWGPKNLRAEDWDTRKSEEGKEYRGLAITALSKCFDTLKENYQNAQEQVAWLSAVYDNYTDQIKSSDDEWAMRQQATLYRWTGRKEEAISYYKDLLIRIGNRFFLWSELASCVSADTDLAIALYSKALLSERNEDYLDDIHLALAELFFKKGMLAEAKRELVQYKSHREERSWPILPAYYQLNCQIPETTEPAKSNKEFYMQQEGRVEEYAYADQPAYELTLVERKEEKGITMFAMTDGKDIFFHVKGTKFPILKKAKLGSTYTVRCSQGTRIVEESNPYCSWQILEKSITIYKPLTMTYKNASLWSGLPLQYGYVDYVNQEKQKLHIITPDSELIFCPVEKATKDVKKGDFVGFRYHIITQPEKRTKAFSIFKAERDTAIASFNSQIVVVDNVNEKKKLFHFQVGEGKEGGVVLFSETPLRPCVGDLLGITSVMKTDKEGKKRCVRLDIRESDGINYKVKKTVKGRLDCHYGHDIYDGYDTPNFAFLDDCYISYDLLEEQGITSNCMAEAVVIYEGDSKWKAISVRKL